MGRLRRACFAAAGQNADGRVGDRPRTCRLSRRPQTCTTEVGDAALMDISQRVNGYWSGTNTHIIGGCATAEQRRYAKTSILQPPSTRCVGIWRRMPGRGGSGFRSFGLQPARTAAPDRCDCQRLPGWSPMTTPSGGNGLFRGPGVYQGPGGTFGLLGEDGAGYARPGILSDFAWGLGEAKWLVHLPPQKIIGFISPPTPTPPSLISARQGLLGWTPDRWQAAGGALARPVTWTPLPDDSVPAVRSWA